MNKNDILNCIEINKLVAVIRGSNAQEAIEVSRSTLKGGIKVIEITYTTPDIEEVFKNIKKTEALIGAGSVLDAETARHAILHGAKFIVSPHFKKEISIVCNRYGIPYLPGAMTVKEIVTAKEYGVDIIKLFPANHFQPSFISAVHGPVPDVKIMPTGGINKKNLREWLDAGAVSVGIGSDLTKAYNNFGEEGVINLSKEYLDILNNKN